MARLTLPHQQLLQNFTDSIVLCVEEQFYLVWPFVVYQVRKRETLMKICLAVIVLSPVIRGILSEALSRQLLHMELFYRSLPTRLDALLSAVLLPSVSEGRKRHSFDGYAALYF